MSIARKRIVSLALAVCLLLGMTLAVPRPVTVSAAVGMQEGKATITRNSTVVAFGGYEWWVIGETAIGNMASDPTAITLLAKNDDFGTVQFDSATNRTPASSAYEDSLLHMKMVEIYHDTDIFSAKERERINPVTLDDVNTDPNGYNIGSLSDQYVWPLSMSEAHQSARPITVSSDDWWLRSPGSSDDVCVGDPSGHYSGHDNQVSALLAVRPAFQLNLASVIFTSDASGKPTSLATASLSAAEPPTGVIKFTMEDESQTLNVTATTQQATQAGPTLTFGYSNATTGADQWVSCFLENEIASGQDYYGKLIDASSGSAENGNLSIPLSGVDDGDYTLHIFSEQDNGGNYTDFASDPITMTVQVNSNVGTVSNFNGDVLSDDAALLKVAGENISVDDGDGDSVNPYKAAITLDNSVTSVDDTNLEAAAGATAKLVDSTFATSQSPVTLAEGDNDLYIKVTAEDNETVRYYHVTATRSSASTGYDITVTPNPQEGGNPTATPTNAVKDETVTLEAKPASGYTFDRWESSDGITFASQTQLSTTFTMPDNAVEITAYYKQDENPPTGTAPSITTDSLPDGKVGEAYSETLTATGDTPINWTVSGSLPLGFSISGSGEIHGTPEVAGTSDFTVKAENAHGVDTKALSIKIISDDGGTGPTDPTDPTNPTIPGGNGSGSTRSGRSGSSSGGSTYTPIPKTTLPASAFSWSGRTLTIDHDSISPLGLLSIQWNGQTLERGVDYGVYQGSVIVRFGEDFIAAQSPGDHTVRVEFLNHTGEVTVTVGATGAAGDGPATSTGGPDNPDTGGDGGYADNATHNPSTGGYPDDYMGDNPNTGDGRGVWLALLLGSIGGAVAWRLRRLRVKQG